MPDYKLDALVGLADGLIRHDVRSPGIAGAVRAFDRNLDRVKVQAYAPGALCEAAYEAGRSYGAKFDVEGAPNGVVTPFGYRVIQAAIDISSGPLGDYLEGLLGSILTGAWTAFEVLAGDLWESAINAEPDILSKMKGQPRPGQRRPDRQGGYGGRRSIELDDIHRHGLDIKHRMGTILRADYRFDKLAEIERAYAQAFDVDRGAVLAYLDRGPLDGLSATRNLLVHRSGIVDAEFLRRKPTEAAFARLAVGDPLPLDGEVVAAVARPAIDRCLALISAVDEWLVAHPGGRVVSRPLGGPGGVELSADDADRHDEPPRVPEPPVGEA